MRKNTSELMVASVYAEPDQTPFGSLSPRTSIDPEKESQGRRPEPASDYNSVEI
jgi:hypothetical protein